MNGAFNIAARFPDIPPNMVRVRSSGTEGNRTVFKMAPQTRENFQALFS